MSLLANSGVSVETVMKCVCVVVWIILILEFVSVNKVCGIAVGSLCHLQYDQELWLGHKQKVLRMIKCWYSII